MIDIWHRIGAVAPIDEVYSAIATPAGVAAWWTGETSGDGDLGTPIEVTFRRENGDLVGSIEFEVEELEPGKRVVWRFTGGPEEWLGTRAQFELTEADGGFTILNFGHLGWAEEVEFLHHCSTKWATYLLSLKQLVETGSGAPSPRDVMISDWH
ncbi:SRPBCC domain-containing protein [Nocardioides humilatus]|uniref:SRPBCC domain-containing protein n=1 Tax=Nocardioides humilatus TaxID=2607660 RepID=A0A5B1LKW6_9ACTN|nr:SRPBCC domain-containing protein [Nocardioides humilatus]KAA1421342.1 SRPBCC domain-containing protein [Nocardioides humilatus]